MSEETPGTEEQLFDSDAGEVADDDATDSEADFEETADEEQEQSLDLDEDQQAPIKKAEDSKFTQLEAFKKKVKAGDIKSADDLPKAQKWMADYLKFPVSNPKLDPDTLKSELLQEMKDERKNEMEAENFEEVYDLIKEQATAKQKGEINERFKALRAKGLSRLDAITLSAELAKVDLEGVVERKRAMRIPVPGKMSRKSVDLNDFSEAAKNLSPQKQVEYLESLQ